MKSIIISDELHKMMKLEATKQGITIKEYLENLIKKSIK